MSTRPRTPEHYPRMKVRGEGRRRIAPLQRSRRSFTQFSLAIEQAVISLAALTATPRRLVTRTPEAQARVRAYYDGYNAISHKATP